MQHFGFTSFSTQKPHQKEFRFWCGFLFSERAKNQNQTTFVFPLLPHVAALSTLYAIFHSMQQPVFSALSFIVRLVLTGISPSLHLFLLEFLLQHSQNSLISSTFASKKHFHL